MLVLLEDNDIENKHYADKDYGWLFTVNLNLSHSKMRRWRRHHHCWLYVTGAAQNNDNDVRSGHTKRTVFVILEIIWGKFYAITKLC